MEQQNGSVSQNTVGEAPMIESTETDAALETLQQRNDPNATSTVTDDQWRSMKSIIDVLYDHRLPDGHDPSKVFHRKVNKRVLPDYYEVIKEPIALSTLKARLNTREYKNFAEFVRDCALIVHNAQTYNRPEAQAYQDALIIKALMEGEFQKLADTKIIEQEVAILPDLGEIPPADPQPTEGDDDEDEDDDDDDEDTEEEETVKKKRGRGRPSNAFKREQEAKGEAGDKGIDAIASKRRGRPPRVDTPMEARIKTVLKAIRKFKNDTGQIMVHHFERLPDKSAMPEYFAEIKDPIAIDLIKRKQKRKKYHSVDHFMRDMELMYENAKAYNEDYSQIYKDAVILQRETRLLAEQEKARPDTEYLAEEGRIPLPNGILHNGELWKVGDWVHIQNANDVTKPIVAQIQRAWQDTDSQKWINACWYYRPEQTVHHFEKHFYPNEVVKTGQYRDHNVDEIIDRCFVMFFTRYSRGRPRGFPPDKEVYVCEARYNEEKHKLNKIKTWASCLPDEVRDKDYEMDLFAGVRKEKKAPSPLLHMLKDNVKHEFENAKPVWGADNAPPMVGAIYKGPRDENQSPPPEPTPSPPPPAPAQLLRQPSTTSMQDSAAYRQQRDVSAAMEAATQAFSNGAHTSSIPQSQPRQTSHASIPQYPHNSASPAPTNSQPQQMHQHASSPQNQPTPQPQAHQSHARPPLPQQTSLSNHQPPSFTPQTNNSSIAPPPATRPDHYTTPRHSYQQASVPPPRTAAIPNADIPGQRANEVYMLSDTANASIPDDIRSQFHVDEKGHVLFFTTPPLDTLGSDYKPGDAVGHSLNYMATKIRRKEALAQKRKMEEVTLLMESAEKKRLKREDEETVKAEVAKLADRAFDALKDQIEGGNEVLWKSVFGKEWQVGREVVLEEQEKRRKEWMLRQRKAEDEERRRKDAYKVSLRRAAVFLDDGDPRF
ncbi:hypothetical protein MMC25_002322 [Agyrium rufum]|nr:hypothetical protein [Agyrium rufum]